MTTRRVFPWMMCAALLLAACQPATPSPEAGATLKEVQGQSSLKQPGDSLFSPAAVGMVLQQKGSVQTGDDGQVRMDLPSGTIIRVGPSSLYTLVSSQSSGGSGAAFALDLGSLFTVLSGGSADVTTPSGVASVEGSYLGVSIDPVTKGVSVTCLEGHCTAANKAGTAALTTGQAASLLPPDAATGQYAAPVVSPMTPEQYQQWFDVSVEARRAFNISATLTAIVPTATLTPTETDTPTPTATDTPTATPTLTDTPTSVSGVQSFPGIVVETTYCHFGPGNPYLYDYGLNTGALMQVIGRNADGSWLYIEASLGQNPCWINAKLMKVDGRILDLPNVYPDQAPLPQTPYTTPPDSVKAERRADQVGIYWSDTYRRPDLDPGPGQPKYIVEVWHCVAGQLVFDVYGTDELAVTVQDEFGCSSASSGRILVQDKEGFSKPEAVPWPLFLKLLPTFQLPPSVTIP